MPIDNLPLIQLIRVRQSEAGTFGILSVPSLTETLYTVEDDWRDNARGRSCIPAGQYALHRSVYFKHGFDVFEVVGVPGRQRILIHPGNTEEDTEGCILPGLAFGKIMVEKDEDTGQPNVIKDGVRSSKIAFDRFMAALAHTDQAVLTVEWADGLPSSVSTPV